MNRTTYKKVKAKAEYFVLEWIRSILPEEEAKKVTLDNYKALVPSESHVFANNRFLVSAYTPRWFRQKIKQKMKSKPLDKIKLEDLV